jgi:hypothetical protein
MAATARRWTWDRLTFLLALAACAPAPRTNTLALPSSEAPGVRILQPAGCAEIPTTGDPVDVEVRYAVVGLVYPQANRGVALVLDGAATPFAVVESAGPVLLGGIAPGRHRVAACVVEKGADGAWAPPGAPALGSLGEGGCTCDVVTVDVTLVGCSVLAADPITGDPECNPAAPAKTCCLDGNPCSLETCDTSAATPTCRFASVSPDCCLSDLDCGADQFCHLVDDPASAADDALAVHRCASCALCGPGVQCPTACGACPSCPAEDTCGGGLCPLAPPDPEPEPEPDPDVAAETEPAPESTDVAPEGPASELGSGEDKGEGEGGPDAPGYTVEVTPEADGTVEAPEGGACTPAGRSSSSGASVLLVAWLGLAHAAGRSRRREPPVG